MAEFYYRLGPNEFGPLAAAELRQMAREGLAVPEGEVRRGKTGPWVRADRVQGLFVTGSAPAIGREPSSTPPPGPPVKFEALPETEFLAPEAPAPSAAPAEAPVPDEPEPAESGPGVTTPGDPGPAAPIFGEPVPDDLSALENIVDTEIVGEVRAAAEPPPPGVEGHRHSLLRKIARGCRFVSAACLLVGLVGAVPAWIQAQYRLDSSVAGVLAAVSLAGGLGLLAIVLFSMGESIKLLIDIEQNTRQTYELLARQFDDRDADD